MRVNKVIALLLCSCLLLGCTRQDVVTNTDAEEKNERIQIGITFDSFVIERWRRDRDVLVSAAKELGADVNVQSANGNVEEQQKQIDYFIEKGMNVIIVVCIDSDSLGESIKKAKNAGIKVIAYDRLIRNADVDLYITFDNEMVGRLMAQTMIDKGAVKKGSNVLMLGGSPSDSNVPLVENGFRALMEGEGINIVDSTHADGWRAELAGEYVYNHPDMMKSVDAIMCGNDNLAGFTIHALAEQRLAGNIAIVGQDAELEACQRIVEGTQLMTVYKPVEKLAKRAAECAVMLAKNEKLTEDDVTTVFDGTGDVPYIGLEPVAVTKDNIDEVIIDSGFHMREDVYLNVPEDKK